MLALERAKVVCQESEVDKEAGVGWEVDAGWLRWLSGRGG